MIDINHLEQARLGVPVVFEMETSGMGRLLFLFFLKKQKGLFGFRQRYMVKQIGLYSQINGNKSIQIS